MSSNTFIFFAFDDSVTDRPTARPTLLKRGKDRYARRAVKHTKVVTIALMGRYDYQGKDDMLVEILVRNLGRTDELI